MQEYEHARHRRLLNATVSILYLQLLLHYTVSKAKQKVEVILRFSTSFIKAKVIGDAHASIWYTIPAFIDYIICITRLNISGVRQSGLPSPCLPNRILLYNPFTMTPSPSITEFFYSDLGPNLLNSHGRLSKENCSRYYFNLLFIRDTRAWWNGKRLVPIRLRLNKVRIINIIITHTAAFVWRLHPPSFFLFLDNEIMFYMHGSCTTSEISR